MNKILHTDASIKLKNEILDRFSPFLKDGNIDYTENLSAQLDLYAAHFTEAAESKQELDDTISTSALLAF